MSNLTQHSTVAVITATIGRASLHRTIQSVQTQIYPCKHYIFVDGEQYHQAVKEIVKDYPDVIVTYLPMNTGAGGMYNSYINAVAPFLVQEDIICYLDDDNWIDEHHVEYLVQDMVQYHTDYAYSLRYFIDDKEQIICEDNSESLGFWSVVSNFEYKVYCQLNENKQINLQGRIREDTSNLIDVSCIALCRKLAQELALIWRLVGMGNDRYITDYLMWQKKIGICTGKRTLFYLENIHRAIPNETIDIGVNLNIDELMKLKIAILKQRNAYIKQISLKENKAPWECKTLFKDGQFIVLE